MTVAPEVRTLLERSVEWRLLGLLFEYPAGGWRTRMESLLPTLARAEIRAMAESALAEHSEGLHIALFGPAGTVPVREVTFKGGVQFGYLMAELESFYQAFGYEPATEEAVDHLAVQLGFLSYLHFKQAAALLERDQERAAIAAEAAGTFLKEHVALQAEPVLRKLEMFGPEFLIDAARRIAEYAGPAPRSAYPMTGDDEEIGCGAAPQADQLVSLQP